VEVRLRAQNRYVCGKRRNCREWVTVERERGECGEVVLEERMSEALSG